jgi:hypothetical protein
MEKLALTYKKTKQLEEAKKLFEQVIETRKRVQEADHPDTTSCMANLASIHRDQGHLEEAEKLEAMTDILQRKRYDVRIAKEEVVKIARSFDEEVMQLLLDWKGNEVQITEGVVIAAAENRQYGEGVMRVLLDRKGNEVQITEGAVVQIAKLFGKGMMQLLLDWKGNEV